MEELELQEKPGLFSKIAGMLSRHDDEDDEEVSVENPPRSIAIRSAYRYHITVRRQIVSFDDALAAANGLKSGEQQIMNLSGTDPVLRQKIVDFMCGVNFAQEGTWEEVGEHIYLLVPATAFVEVAPASPRMNAGRN
jgi:cell division inhibitor SepF